MSKNGSKSITVHFDPNPQNGKHVLSIAGRATSVLGRSQGDHVTAYNLVEQGIYRAISNLEKAEIEELFSLTNRNSLREKRNKLYDFISAIAVLDLKNSEKLYNQVDAVLHDYNSQRVRKGELRKDTKSYQENPRLIGKELSAALSNVEQAYNKNGDYIREIFLKITNLVLTFYNHIPGTAYFPIDSFKASSNEGSIVRTSISEIEKSITACQNVPSDTVASRVQKDPHLSKITKAIARLMHYPEITDDDILGKHRGYTETNKTKLSAPRDNTEENLVKALTRHLYIVFTVYPELKALFSEQDIVTSFVKEVIEKEKGWPIFNKDKNAVKRISKSVTEEINSLSTLREEKKYYNREKYEELVSSDDEEEPTKPRVKQEIENKSASQDEVTELKRQLEEAQRLNNAFKEGISNGSIILSPAVKLRLKRDFPDVLEEKKRGR